VLYSQRGDLSLAAALLLSAGVTATAEEVFWRGFAQWGGGALAPLGCHVVWTGLMLSFPVVSREAISG
jgi:hypothetical protein